MKKDWLDLCGFIESDPKGGTEARASFDSTQKNVPSMDEAACEVMSFLSLGFPR